MAADQGTIGETPSQGVSRSINNPDSARLYDEIPGGEVGGVGKYHHGKSDGQKRLLSGDQQKLLQSPPPT